MKRSIIWKTAFRSILKNKRRSLLTMLGIVIGIASVITIVAIGNGFKEDMVDKLSAEKQKENVKKISFSAYNTSDMFSDQAMFTDNDLGVVRMVPGVEKIDFDQREVDGAQKGTLNFQAGPKNLSVTYELADKTTKELLAGRQLNDGDNAKLDKTVVVDELVAKELYQDPTAAVNRTFPYKEQLFTIVGVTTNTSGAIGLGNDDSLLYFPKKTYEHYFGKLKDTSTLKLTVAPGYQPDQVLKETIKTLSQQGTMKNSGTYQEYNVKDTIKEMGSLLNNLTLFISAIAAISLVIAGVGVMNMMYISVSERIKEIGIRRALGGTASDIKKQFLTEGIALTLIGGINGYLLGMIIAYLASMALPFSVRPDLMTVSLAIGISVFIGVVFSYFPASAASKKDLIDIMK